MSQEFIAHPNIRIYNQYVFPLRGVVFVPYVCRSDKSCRFDLKASKELVHYDAFRAKLQRTKSHTQKGVFREATSFFLIPKQCNK